MFLKGKKTESAQNDGQTKGVVRIALDSLGWGDGVGFGKDEKRVKKPPEGIASSAIYSDILRIGWPALLEFILAQLVSMFDQMQVGQVGAFAISAVGIAAQPKMLLNTAFMSMNVGVTAMVARARGAGDKERANLMLRQGLLFTMVASTLVTILGYIFAPQLIGMMGSTDAQTVEAAITYLRINLYAMIPFALTSTCTAALRAVGNSRISFLYNTAANVINVFLNWVLITGNLGSPAYGVAGAAAATSIGQTAAFFMAVYAITNKNAYLSVSFKQSFKPDFDALRNIIKIGIPAMIEQLIMRAGVVLYQRTVNSLGTIAYATHTICMNIQALSFMNGMGWATSATSLVGQSLGKKRYDMAMVYSKFTQRVGFVTSAVIGACCFFFGGNIASLYTDDAAIISTAASILMFVALMQPFNASQQILAGSMRGAGDTKVVAYITAATMFGLRPFLAWLLVTKLDMGLYGAWYALVGDQIVRTILVMLRYNSGKWKLTFKAKV